MEKDRWNQILRDSLVVGQHTTPVETIAFHPNGQILAAGGGEMRKSTSLTLWNLQEPSKSIQLEGHSDAVTSTAFYTDRRTGVSSLASGSHDKTLRLWDVNTGRPLLELKQRGDVLAIAVDGNTSRIYVAWVSSSFKRGITQWDLAHEPKAVEFPAFHRWEIFELALSSDGRTLVSGGLDHSIVIWDLSGGEPPLVVNKMPDDVTGLAFSPDDSLIAVGMTGFDSNLKIIDSRTGSLFRDDGHHQGITSVAFSPDGRLLAFGSGNGDEDVVKICETKTWKRVAMLSGHSGEVLAVSFSADGKWIGSCGNDGTVRLWEVGKAIGPPINF